MTINVVAIKNDGIRKNAGTIEDLGMGEIVARGILHVRDDVSSVEFLVGNRVVGEFDRFEVAQGAFAKFAPEAPMREV